MSNGYNFYDNAPRGYTLCLSTGCASADHCLRQLAARHLSRKPMSVSVANPLLTDTKGEGACQFFRKAEKVRVAYGFRQAMSRIESGKAARARALISPNTSRRNFYYLLNGEQRLTPEMQEHVAAVLQDCGLQTPIDFDRYEWQYEW